MIKWILKIGLIISSIVSLNSQIPEPPKFETKVKENSYLNKESERKGVKLIKLQTNNCDYESTWKVINRLQNRITQINQTKDTLNIKVAIIAECCRDFLGEIEIKGQNTVNLIYTEYGRVCECLCCYELEYKIVSNLNPDFKYQVNSKPVKLTQERYKTIPIKYELELGDTINLVDKYGMRQGYWKQKNQKGQIILEGTYGNKKDDYYSNKLTGFTGRIVNKYYENGQIEREEFRVDGHEQIILRSYYRNGKIKQECLNEHKYEEIRCQKWDEKGVLISKEE